MSEHSPDFERSDADPRLVAALAAGLALFLIAVPYLLRAGYPSARGLPSVARDLPEPPQPRLQVDPKGDLARLRSAESRELAGYGWADRERRIVRIPIERAMALLAERGLPGWPSDAPAGPAPR